MNVNCSICRTPGLDEDGFNFWQKFQTNVNDLLNQEENKAKVGLRLTNHFIISI